MAPQKKSNLLMSVVGIALTAVISLQSWIVGNIIVVREDVASIKSEMKADHDISGRDHTTVSILHGRVQGCEQQNSNHDKRISKIEALLPESIRKKLINF